MRRIYLAAATTLALVPIGGPAEAGERQRGVVLMGEDEGARKVKAPYPPWTAIGVAKTLGNGITEIKITARRPAAAAGRE